MGIMDWFVSNFGKKNKLKLDAYIGNLTAEIYYKELAINSAINLISNAIASSEFLTFRKGEEVRETYYYLLNVEPNKNVSANRFWRDVIYKLIYKNECLILQIDGALYAVDDFNVDKFVFKSNIYKNIQIDNYSLDGVFFEDAVLHLKLHNKKMLDVIDGLYSSYGKLITVASKHNLRKRAKRGTLEIPGTFGQTEGAQEELEDLLQHRFKAYFEAETGAVLPLTNGLKYEENEDRLGNNPSQEGRDIRAFIDDIFDFVAIAFNIPPQLLKGDVADTEKAVNNFLTFCIKPLADMISDEINRKLYGKEKYLVGTFMKLDTSRIKHADIKDLANAMDILFKIGANTINDNLRLLGREGIDEDWANARFITKNYATIGELIKGGD